MHIVVFCLGDPIYAAPAQEVLRDYFKVHDLSHTFVCVESHNPKKAHPSWLKLLCHQLVPGEQFILNWDLDLLPVRGAHDIRGFIDTAKLNMAMDSSLLTGFAGFNVNFKYNGGLLGIPADLAAWSGDIYDKCAPGVYPSYEQYYLNDRIVRDDIQVHRLPNELNTLYPKNAAGMELWKAAEFRHYTFGVTNAYDRLSLIQEHRNAYFVA